MYLKSKEKKKYNKSSLHTTSLKKKTLPLTKISISYTNFPPKNMTTLILKLLPIFVMNDKGQGTQAVISSSLEELASSSSSSSLSSESPSLSSSSYAAGKGKGEATKPPRRAYRRAIRQTRVVT